MRSLEKFVRYTWTYKNEVNFLRFYKNQRFFAKVAEEGDKSNEELYSIEADDFEARLEEKELEIENKRNKSMLWPQHYNLLHGKVPYSEPKCDVHLSLKYKRRMFGRYGYKSGVNPGALWPSAEDIKERFEYEKIAYPYTIQEMLERAKLRHEAEEQAIQERQQKIINNLKKLDQWKKEVNDRANKRLEIAVVAKQKKDALIEEVRRHFGFKINPTDVRFKEMLLQKEKDNKKKLKQEKSKARQEKTLADLSKAESGS